MTKQPLTKKQKKLIPVVVTVATILAMTIIQAVSAQAAPAHGFGQGAGRPAPVNENDFHTVAWDRFSHNYQFNSGSDHRFELGRHTQFDGTVPVDVFTVNIRRDANVSLQPPRQRIFSGQFPTDPTSRFFTQPVSPHFHQPNMIHSTWLDPRFDTVQQGVNHQPQGNPLNIHTTGGGHGSGGFLPPTSIGN